MRFYARIIAVGGLAVACTGDPPPVPLVIEVGDGSIRLEEDSSAQLELEATGNVDPIEYEIVMQPELGQLIGTRNQFEYVPNDNENGTDTFTWRAFSEAEDVESEEATVTVFIEPVNDGPTGIQSQFSTEEDTPVAGALPADDVDDATLTYVLVTTAENGRVEIGADGTFTYSPDANFVGADSFLWSALDAANASTGPVRVDINVQETNDPPMVGAASFTLSEDTQLDGQLTAIDPDGDDLTWTIVAPPASGDLDFSEALGTFTYTPNANFFGNDSFDVIANDGQVDSAVATVDFTVSAVNDVPVVPSVTFNTDEDIPLTDVVMAMDIEGQSSSFIVSETPRKGVISLDPQTGMFTYTPNLNEFGLDEFAVIANDGFGDSLPGRITININQVNDAPELTSFGLLTTDEDVPITGQITGIDPENDVLTYSVSTLPANGSITLSESTGAFAYVPDEDYNGTDLFEITGFDGTDFSAPSPVSVVVLPVNDAPRVTPTQLVVVTGQEGQITLQASDPEGDTLFYLVETAPQFGSAFLDSVTGNLSYTSNPNYVGPDAIIYTVTDGTESTQGSLPISVSADTDGDTVGDLTDNCPNVANEDQSDVDSNGRGDKCDCVTEAFGSSLNPEFFAASGQITPVEEPTTSPTWSLRLNGNGAFVETVAQPSCTTYQYAVQLATGVAPPETMDSFRILVSNDGGPFQLLHQEFGTGFEESFSTIRGLTTGLDVSGDVVFRLEVQSDELSDLFIVDDFFLGCDTDADFLADCVESFLPGYDLTNADADGDGLIDGDEFAAGTDPNAADTDFDGVPDNIDNCGVVPNPMQEDADGNGIGDFCEEFGFFDDFESGTVLDAAMWESSVGEAYVWAPGGVYADGANSLELNGPRSFSSGPPSLGTGINGVATTNPYDFSFCTDAVVNARWVNRDSFSGRDLVIEYNDGSGAWAEIGRAPGAAALNAVNQGAWPITNNGANLSTTAQARLRNDSFTWDDRFYIDNFAFDCDSDADLLGNKLELDVYGTNAFNPDSDGDGVDDGTEIINGTDPLNGSSN